MKVKISEAEHCALYIAHCRHSIGSKSRQMEVNNCWQAIAKRHDIDTFRINNYNQNKRVIIVDD